MKPQRVFRKASSPQSICLFCVQRLREQSGSTFTPFAHRSFTRAVWPRQHAGQAAPGSSFPDPDLPQPPPQQTNVTQGERKNTGSVPLSEDLGFRNSQQKPYEPAQNEDSTEHWIHSRNGSANTSTSDTPSQWRNLPRRNTQDNSYSRSYENSRGSETSQRNFGHEYRRRTDFVGLRNPPRKVTNSDQQSLYSINREQAGRITKHAVRHSNYAPPDRFDREGFAFRRRGPLEGEQRHEQAAALGANSLRGSSSPRVIRPGAESSSRTEGIGMYPTQRASRTDRSREASIPDEDQFRKTMAGYDGESGTNKAWNESRTRQAPDSGFQSRRMMGAQGDNRSTGQAWNENRIRRSEGGSGLPNTEQESRAPFVQRNDRDTSPLDQRTAANQPDASLRRRGREDAPGRTDRRAEKFDYDGDDERIPDRQVQAQRELRKRQRREKIEASREAHDRKIELPAFISVANLATALRVRVEPFVKKLDELGFEDIATDHVLSFENASLVAMEYNYQTVEDRSEIEDLRARPEPSDWSVLPQRPPVVTIMGHVDHGKTTLLDYLRQSSVAAQEHGGITQHIGAFSVPLSSGKLITFLDTPGHAAFLSMRQRGANVTDIVILVVAADDSVKPQTIEAIKHAKAAQVPIIVAINKIDKEEANIERVKQDLLRHDIEVEDFGGDVQAYPVSGKTGEGVDELVEAMVTQAEILDMRADTKGAAEGWVLEATTKKAGRIATVLVRCGTLRPGNVIVAGNTWARVRTLKNEAGVQVEYATPGTPVEVDGWRDQPIAGDEVLEAETEQRASSVVAYRDTKDEQVQAAKDMEAINENRRLGAEKREREKEQRAAIARGEDNPDVTDTRSKAANLEKPGNTELYCIIKADVSGSAEAVEGSVAALPLSKHAIRLNVLRTGVGAVSEFDIDHASAVPFGNGFIISFNQQIPQHIAAEAEKVGLRIINENIIYKVTDVLRLFIESKLPPLVTKRVIGEGEVAQVFEINTKGREFSKVAGSKVRNGIIDKGKKIRAYRGGVVDDANLIYDGTISSLKNHKKDVTEMRKGTECGVSFAGWEDFQVGDIFQSYEEKSEPRRLT